MSKRADVAWRPEFRDYVPPRPHINDRGRQAQLVPRESPRTKKPAELMAVKGDYLEAMQAVEKRAQRKGRPRTAAQIAAAKRRRGMVLTPETVAGRIIETLEENETMTVIDIVDSVDSTRSTVQSVLYKLRKAGIIGYEGRKTGWRLIIKG